MLVGGGGFLFQGHLPVTEYTSSKWGQFLSVIYPVFFRFDNVAGDVRLLADFLSFSS